MEQEKDGKGEWEGKADLDKEERETQTAKLRKMANRGKIIDRENAIKDRSRRENDVAVITLIRNLYLKKKRILPHKIIYNLHHANFVCKRKKNPKNSIAIYSFEKPAHEDTGIVLFFIVSRLPQAKTLHSPRLFFDSPQDDGAPLILNYLVGG